MVQKVVDALQIKPKGSYIDCNLGEGGHALAMLRATADLRLLGLDLDAQALEGAKVRLHPYLDRTTLTQENFGHLKTVARARGFETVDGVLFDLGLSSLQVDTAARGFGFRQEGRLDMRFDSSQEMTAYEVVNEYAEQELADVIFRFGEDPRSRRIARAITHNRPIETTTQLAKIVSRAVGGRKGRRTHPATRTFQAIRMTVNKELDNLQNGITQAIDILCNNGRLVVISYHSLEDRLVKSILRREARECICPPEQANCVCHHTSTVQWINRRVLRPALAEMKANPRSRSARMRVAKRV